MRSKKPKSDFVHVNGIRLHYLDWGGDGQTLIFLTGMGSSAYIYGGFAPLFTDKFRVLAITRRGHGDSDYPESGYDANTLIEDIRQFMDALQIEKAVFAGHSIAGVELTHFAATHPERVEKLVYLDALDDRRREPAIHAQNPLNKIQIKREESAPPRTFEEYIAIVKKDIPEFAEIWNEVWEEEFRHGTKVNDDGIYVDRMPNSVENALAENLITAYAPPQAEDNIPRLYFFGRRKRKLTDIHTDGLKVDYEKFYNTIMEPYFNSVMAEIQGRFPQAKIIIIPNGHHYCFIAQEEFVHAEMKNFLLK